jgi:DNA-binding CsgD family transcriptional regulator
MGHLLVLLYTLALAAGSASIAFTHHLAREWRGELLRAYLRFLVSLNVCVVFNLAAAYLESALAGGFPLDDHGALAVATDLAGMALVGVIVYHLAALMAAAGGRAMAAAFGRIITGSLLIVAASVVAVALAAPEIRGHLHAVIRLSNLALIVAGAASTVPTLFAAQRLPQRRGRLVVCFSGLHLAVFCTILVGFFLPNPVAWPLLAAALLVLNLIPLTLLRGLGAERLAGPGSLAGTAPSLDALQARYAITPRELEVVAQALTGKTNSEISDALFISAATVKNHLHSVFQKCEVRNRVELASLAHRLADTGRDEAQNPH